MIYKRKMYSKWANRRKIIRNSTSEKSSEEILKSDGLSVQEIIGQYDERILATVKQIIFEMFLFKKNREIWLVSAADYMGNQ